MNYPCPEHNHSAPDEKIENVTFRQEVLSEIQNKPTKRLKEVYEVKLETTTTEKFLSYKQIRGSMPNVRKRSLPPLTKSVREDIFEGEWKNFTAESHFCWRKITMFFFSKATKLQFLGSATATICDRNFKIAPKQFAQL